MPSTLKQAISSDPLRLPETFGAKALKVGIESEGIGIGSVVFEALVTHFGTVKELAYALGECDPSQARAELKAADFRRLEKHATTEMRTVIAEAIDRAYGKLRSADDDADLAITLLFQVAQRLAQYVAFRRTA
jgi:hypothetical protein